MINVFSNTLGTEEIEEIIKVINSRWIGSYINCDEFEKEFANHLKVEEVLLFNNCTNASYGAHKALGITKGDEVIVTTVNYVGCANAIIDMGAKPVFADVDPVTLNILPSEIERLKTKKTKAVSILHYGGHPADFDKIKAAAGYNTYIIEDSANSVSSSYKGKMCGTMGDAGYFSFDAVKILAMGDGGALYLKSEEHRAKARTCRYLGMSPKTTSGIDSLKEKNNRWWEFELNSTSGKYISNDILAAIGRVQLRKLNGFIKKRKEIWDIYQSELKDIEQIKCPPEPLKDCASSYYFYWINVPEKRDELAKHFVQNGVYTTFRYFPLHLVKYYNDKSRLPNSEKINESTLNLPLHQNLTESDLDKIIGLIKEFFK